MSDLINAQVHISNSQALRHKFVMSEVQANTTSSPTRKAPQYPRHAGCFGVALKCLFVTLGSRFWIRQTQVLCKMLESLILFLITALILPTCPQVLFLNFSEGVSHFYLFITPVLVSLLWFYLHFKVLSL